MVKYYAIEYFIKENETDNKITKVKLYETERWGDTYTFTSEPIYCDRNNFIDMVNSREIFVKAIMGNNKKFSMSDTFHLSINNMNYINQNQNSNKDYLTFIPIKIKKNE